MSLPFGGGDEKVWVTTCLLLLSREMSQNKKNAVNNNGNVVMTPATIPAAVEPAAFTFTAQEIAEWRARHPPQGPMMPGAEAGRVPAARGAFSNVYNAAVAAEKKKGGYKKLSSRKRTRRSKSRRRRA